MKRSDFLAIIPSLSAIPFIGKDIIRKSDRIEIFQPEQVQQEISNTRECEVHIVRNGRILAKGYVDSLSINHPLLETTCRDNGGARSFIPGNMEITAQVSLNPPDDWEEFCTITTRNTFNLNA
jgi:hypothetical protein